MANAHLVNELGEPVQIGIGMRCRRVCWLGAGEFDCENIEVRGIAKPIEIICIAQGRDLPPKILGARVEGHDFAIHVPGGTAHVDSIRHFLSDVPERRAPDARRAPPDMSFEPRGILCAFCSYTRIFPVNSCTSLPHSLNAATRCWR
jgi:hypothetical protein